MAVSFSIHSLLAPRLSASFSSSSRPSKETKSFALQSLHLNPPSLRPILGLSLSNQCSPLNSNCKNYRGRAFKSFSAVPDTGPSVNEEGDDYRGDAKASGGVDQESLASLETIITAYKEALLNGDDKTASEIEGSICIIENKKNKLEQKALALSAEITSGKEKFIRLQADFDNFRKRLEKERLTTRSDAQGEVIESLLPMVDNFERAKQQIKPETEMEKKIDTSYQGIYKQFVEIMRSLRVAVVPTVGKPFDPSLHEAIAREESQEFREGIVIQEFRRGFLLGDRLLRPAMVKVSSGPGNKKVPMATEKSTEQPAAAAGVEE